MLTNKPYLEIGKDELNFTTTIGRGAQGVVYKALWKTRQTTVAVKQVLHFDPEISLLERVRHKHIVPFLGAVEEDLFKAIVLEYAENSLYEIIHADPPDFEQMLKWSRHVALGLNYLHNLIEPKIIHRDLKSKNVLIVSPKMIAKICDFGSSREMTKELTRFSQLHGTVAWMAPEVMRQSNVSEKCDIYSFAILLWELITCKIPYHGEEDAQIMFSVCHRKRRPPIPDQCPVQFSDLIENCWHDDPEKRPSIDNVSKILGNMYLNESLTGEVDHFLTSRQEWEEAFDREIEDIKKQFEAIEEQWAKKLEEKDNEIENLKKNRFNYMAPEEKGVSGWKEIEVVQWINQLILGDEDYSNLFFEHHITGSRLLNLTDIDLCRMGISSVGHRKEILNSVQQLKYKIESLENFPPLNVTTAQRDNSAITNPGTEFELAFTFGNNFLPGSLQSRKDGWSLFLYVQGDDIAVASIKCVEFNIGKNDSVKCSKKPYHMNDIRYQPPKSDVTVKVVFKKNIIKPKTWSKEFSVKCTMGGFADVAQVKIYHNEDYISSATPSLASSLSSFSSFNAIDEWNTKSATGAWAAGPPPNLAPSPGFTPGYNNRKDSFPVPTHSPGRSPIARKKYSSGSPTPGNLNRVSSSPAKGSQIVRSRSHEKPRDLQLRSYHDKRADGGTADMTPTHDPWNPRFTSARASLVEQMGPLTLEPDSPGEGISFGSASSNTINRQFDSVSGSTLVNEPSDHQDLFAWDMQSTTMSHLDVRKLSRNRTISQTSASTIASGGSGREEAEDVSHRRTSVWVPDNQQPSSPRSTPSFTAAPPPNSEDKQQAELARQGKLSYAQILQCKESPKAATKPAALVLPHAGPRTRKKSSGSSTSEKTRSNSGGFRGGKGNRRGSDRSRGKAKRFSVR